MFRVKSLIITVKIRLLWWKLGLICRIKSQIFTTQISVFFFYVKIGQPSVKMFAVTLREKAKSAWKNIKKCPWKSPSLRENFVKKQCVKIKILYVKKYKNCMRENKKVPVKKSWKIIKCTFFWRHFSILCLFFWHTAVFVFLIKNSVRETRNLCVKNFNFVCVKN